MSLIIKRSAILIIIFNQQTMGNQLQNFKKETKTDIGDIQALHNILKVSDLPDDSYQTRVNIPEVFCTSKNPVNGMCISKNCKFDSLMCENPQCKACMENHFTCGMIKMPILTGLIQTRNSMHHKLVREIDQIENRVFASLKNRRQVYLKNFFLKGFDKDYHKIVESLFFDGDQFTFNGFKAEQFYTKLKESNSMMEEAERKALRTFTREIERIAVSLTVLETSIMDSYIKRVRIDDLRKSTVSQAVREYVLQSQIIPPQKTQDVKFIYQNLDNPAQLQFLFRASQNGYLGQKFHAVCDNKPHTLTLIRTEFDQIIAGYTPLTWNITKGVAPDQSKQSFLLSLNLKERMDLIRQEKAIQCIATEGPVFGGGSDLAIVNNCHVNMCSTYFPYSYNFNSSDPSKRYKYNQNAWTALTGVPEGKKFKVVEYEVYQVVWD